MQSLARGTITKDRLFLDHLGGKDIGSKSIHDAFRLACHCVPKSPAAPRLRRLDVFEQSGVVLVNDIHGVTVVPPVYRVRR